MTNQPQISADGLSYWDGVAWRTLLSPDGASRWNGSHWVPLAGVGPPPAGVPGRGRRSRPLLLAIGVTGIALLGLIGYLVVSALHPGLVFVTSGVDSAAQFQVELRYRAIYARDVTAIRNDSVPFGATPSAPGVCARGGNKQGCFDTDARVRADLQALLRDLKGVPTPSRYRAADADLRAGAALTIEALELRNSAISSGDPNASFTASNEVFGRALALLQKAAGEFPADSRPEPSLV